MSSSVSTDDQKLEMEVSFALCCFAAYFCLCSTVSKIWPVCLITCRNHLLRHRLIASFDFFLLLSDTITVILLMLQRKCYALVIFSMLMLVIDLYFYRAERSDLKVKIFNF